MGILPTELLRGTTMANKENIIDLVGITRCFEDGVIAVDNLDLHVKKGEFVTFLGPSGCGKTTTLRMIAGFDKPNQGKIYLNGKDITELPPYKRPINTVFQKYALFPHLNIFDNIAYGLKLKKLKVTYQDKDGNKISDEYLIYEHGKKYYQIRDGKVVLEEYVEYPPYPFNGDQLHLNKNGYEHIATIIANKILQIK